MRELAILAYHKVGEPPSGGWRSWFYVPEDEFVSHLEYLRDSGWEVVGANAFLRGLARPGVLPERSALLTFDDGYRSMMTVAAPILVGFAFPSILFVPTDFVGKTNSFENGAEPEEPICGWDDLRELECFGVSVHSHGVSHRAFSKMESPERDAELVRSKAVLEDNLGRSVELFAYPYGDGEAEASLAVERAGYRAAFSYKGGVERLPADDVFRLSRVAVGSGTDVRKKLGGV